MTATVPLRALAAVRRFRLSVSGRFVVHVGFASAIAVAILSVATTAQQQLPAGVNTNMSGGPTYVTLPVQVSAGVYQYFDMRGDPFRGPQNEPNCIVSSRNPLHLMCVMNDYGAVDLPGIDGTEETADSFVGVSQSRTGGVTWEKRLREGYKYDSSTSPLKQYQATSDPVLSAGAAGIVYEAGIAFNRGTNALGAVFTGTWLDLNDREDDPAPFTLVPGSTQFLDSGTAGQFIDRPALWVGLPLPGVTTTLQVPNDSGVLVTQTIPVSPVYYAWATFVGSDSNPHTKIMFRASFDGNKTLTNPVKVSESLLLNQGVQMAQIRSGGQTAPLCLTWRQVATGNNPNAIAAVCSADGGQTFSKASTIAAICPMDQFSSPTAFRTSTIPAMTADDKQFYVVWAERPRNPTTGACTVGDARIKYSTSPDGVSWTAPGFVDANAAPGHQINPAISWAAGKVQVVWEDFRNDASQLFDSQPRALLALPAPFVDPGPGGIDEALLATNAFTLLQNLPATPRRARHTADVYGAQFTGAGFGTSAQVSKYIQGIGVPPGGTPTLVQLQWNPKNVRTHRQMTVPFGGDYNTVASEVFAPADPVNAPGAWTIPTTTTLGDPFFHAGWTDNRNISLWPNEDYTVPRPYTPPTLPATLANNTGSSLADPTQLRPPCAPTTISGLASFAGAKNEDVYSSVLTQGIFAGAPGNNKATSTTLPRAFPVFAQNMTGTEKLIQFSIVSPQPAGGGASLGPLGPVPASGSYPPGTVVPVEQAVAPARTGVVRTVTVTSTDNRAPVRVDVNELLTGPATLTLASLTSSGAIATATTSTPHNFVAGANVTIVGADQPEYNGVYTLLTASGTTFTYRFAGSSAATASTSGGISAQSIAPTGGTRLVRAVWLNGDRSAPVTLQNPSIAQTYPTAIDINQTEFFSIDIANSDFTTITSPVIDGQQIWEQPGWQTPGWQTPGWQTPGWQTPGWQTPGWQTPGWQTPGWQTPGWQTPGWQTSDLSSGVTGSITDVRFPIKNSSNTVTAVNLRAFVNGNVPSSAKFQALAYRLYPTTPSDTCDTDLVGNPQVIVNIPNLDVSQDNFNSPPDSPSAQNASIYVEPGETVYVNIRALGLGANQFDPGSLVVKAQTQTSTVVTAQSLGVLSVTLPGGVFNQLYATSLQASGGVAPYTWSASALPPGLTLSANGTLSGTPASAGTFPFSVSVSDLNAVHTSTRSVSLTIAPAALTVTPSASMVYGTAVPTTYTLAYSPGAPVAGSVNGTLVCTSTATSTSPVGTYQLAGCSGLASSNYVISYGVGTLTITPAPVTITANNKARFYGAANPLFDATYNPASVAGTLSGTLVCGVASTVTASSLVGAYSISCGGVSSTNYTITFVPGTLTVNPVPLSITANNKARVYGTPNPSLDVSYSGFVLSDSPSTSLTGTLSCATTATVASPVGTYPIACGGLSAVNYALTWVPGTLTVGPVSTTLGLTAVPNPALLNQSVALTATVAPVAGTAAPVGTVQFFDGGTALGGAVALLAGVTTSTAKLTTSTLALGPHTITAAYTSGSGNFAGSSSGTALSLKVNLKFLGLQTPYAPPPKTFNLGSSFTLKWQYGDYTGTAVASPLANPYLTVYLLNGCTTTSPQVKLILQQDAGNSSFPNTWQFNWQTGQTPGMVAGCYSIYITTRQTGQTDGPFLIQFK
jgi:hypothetical protein